MENVLKFIAIPLTVLSLPVFSMEYSADSLTSVWISKSSKTECELVQKIPKYGEAFFSIHPEEPLQFGVYQSRNLGFTVKNAELSSLPAPWIHKYPNLKHYPAHVEERTKSNYLSVFGADAEMMVSTLLDAKFPVFTYENRKGTEKKGRVSVMVSAVNFEETYQNFEACRQQLLPFAMTSLQNKVVYFPEKSTAFNLQTLQDMEYLSEYMMAIKRTKLALVNSTKLDGRHASRRFKARSNEIRAFFIKKGIAASRISISEEFMPKDLESHKHTFRMHVFGPDVLKMYWYGKGSTSLSYKTKQRLKLVADYMKYQVTPLILNSHTDGVGRKFHNLQVSRQRGNTMKDYLVSLGIPENKIKVYAYGQTRPVATNRMVSGQAKNRRIELVFSRQH